MSYRPIKEMLYDKDEIESHEYLKHNTVYIYFKNGDVAIRYHLTDVIRLKANGDTVFKNDGWFTHTTKARINQYSTDFTIMSIKGIWYIFDKIDLPYWARPNPKSPNFCGIKFYDGIVIGKDGKEKK